LLSADEENEEIYIRTGEALETNGYYERALEFYLKAIERFPDNEDFLFRIALCYDYIGNSTESAYYYKLYLDINPFSENAWYNLGIIYNKIGLYERAVEAYDFAIAIDNEYFDAVFNKANSLANWGKHREAIEV
jgi:tetratricopeptide (TPR) repeat protein